MNQLLQSYSRSFLPSLYSRMSFDLVDLADANTGERIDKQQL